MLIIFLRDINFQIDNLIWLKNEILHWYINESMKKRKFLEPNENLTVFKKDNEEIRIEITEGEVKETNYQFKKYRWFKEK